HVSGRVAVKTRVGLMRSAAPDPGSSRSEVGAPARPQEASAPPDPLAESKEHLRKFIKAYRAGAEGRLVAEVRALAVPQRYGRPATLSGFFDLADADHVAKLWVAVEGLLRLAPESQPEGTYVTLNPVNLALLARADRRLKPNS